jgi:hypothetical protein
MLLHNWIGRGVVRTISLEKWASKAALEKLVGKF